MAALSSPSPAASSLKVANVRGGSPVVFQNCNRTNDLQDLNVFLVDASTGTPLVTFDTAQTIRKTSNRQLRRAVNVTADQRFAIEIEVRPGFDWADSNGLEVSLGFDVGEQVNRRSVYLLKDDKSWPDLDLPRMMRSGGVHSFRIDEILLKDPEGGNCDAIRCHFYFRRLREDKDVPPSIGLTRTIVNQGKIRIEIARAKINQRLRDNGIQADTKPCFRRETKKKLLDTQNITLEVLLINDPESAKTTHTGNFRSTASSFQPQQSNFDFIYREEGHHQACIAASDIDEIGPGSRTPFRPAQTRPIQVSHSCGTKEDLHAVDPAPSERPARPTKVVLRLTNDKSHEDPNSTIVVPGASNSTEALKPYTSTESICESPTSSQSKESVSSDPTLIGSRVLMLSRRTSSSSLTPVSPNNYHANSLGSLQSNPFDIDTGEVSGLLAVQVERERTDLMEADRLQEEITTIMRRHVSCEERRENLRFEEARLTAEITALEKGREVLELQQETIEHSIRQRRERTQQALDTFRNAIKEIDDQYIPSPCTRKRKRDEAV